MVMKNLGLNRFRTKRGDGVMRQHIHRFGFLGCMAVLSMGAMAHGQLIWTNGPAMSTPRGYHTATVLQDGRILLGEGAPPMTPGRRSCRDLRSGEQHLPADRIAQ